MISRKSARERKCVCAKSWKMRKTFNRNVLAIGIVADSSRMHTEQTNKHKNSIYFSTRNFFTENCNLIVHFVVGKTTSENYLVILAFIGQKNSFIYCRFQARHIHNDKSTLHWKLCVLLDAHVDFVPSQQSKQKHICRVNVLCGRRKTKYHFVVPQTSTTMSGRIQKMHIKHYKNGHNEKWQTCAFHIPSEPRKTH